MDTPYYSVRLTYLVLSRCPSSDAIGYLISLLWMLCLLQNKNNRNMRRYCSQLMRNKTVNWSVAPFISNSIYPLLRQRSTVAELLKVIICENSKVKQSYLSAQNGKEPPPSSASMIYGRFLSNIWLLDRVKNLSLMVLVNKTGF